MRRLVLLAFIWGWSFLFIKVAGAGLTPFALAWSRIALGALVLYAVLRSQGGRVPTDRRSLRHFAVTALVGNILPFAMLAYAEEHITSALTAVLNASTPLFTALFAAVALSERLRAVQLAGLAVGVSGVAVAAGLGADDLAGSSLLATLAAALAGAGYGMAFVYMRRHLVGIPPLVAASGQLAMGAALFWPVALGTSLAEGIELTPTRVGSVVMLGVFGTGIAYVLNYRIIAELGATAASLVTYLIPVVAVVVGIVVLDEPFQWRLVVGGGLTIAGIAAVNRRRADTGRPDGKGPDTGRPDTGRPDGETPEGESPDGRSPGDQRLDRASAAQRSSPWRRTWPQASTTSSTSSSPDAHDQRSSAKRV